MSLLISIEGLDGSGKSTLVKSVVTAMEQDSAFHPWIYATKEPGSKWSGKIPSDLRKMVLETSDLKPLERELLFYVDASLHARFIRNQESAVIVSDRGLWSHRAYLRGYLKTGLLDYSDYILCQALIKTLCYEPHCVVYLNADLNLMHERNWSKQKDAIESNGNEFFRAVLETYTMLSENRLIDKKPLLVLDAIDSTDKNTIKVIEYLKEVFTDEELRNGNRKVCSI